jgi:hypothetical protein
MQIMHAFELACLLNAFVSNMKSEGCVKHVYWGMFTQAQ